MIKVNRKLIFDASKKLGARYNNEEDVAIMDAAITRALDQTAPLAPLQPPAKATSALTVPMILEIASHEGMCLEAYRDSVGVWTWSIGVTNKSGHQVFPRYKDNPTSIERAIEVYIWLLETNYLPAVLKEFQGHDLTEAQLTAALSFHYNTGRIATASWVDDWKAGRVEEARVGIMEWRKPPEVIERRGKERDLFFAGTWSNDGATTLYQVSHKTYTPIWSSAKRIEIAPIVETILANRRV